MVKQKQFGRLKKLVILIGTLIALFFLLITISYFVYNFYYADQILPQSSIGSLELTGKTKQQAQTALEQAIANFEQTPIKFSIDGQTIDWTWQQLGLEIDVSQTVDHAYKRGRSSNISTKLVGQISLLIRPESAQLVFNLNDETVNSLIGNLSKKFDRNEKDASFEIEDNILIINEEKVGYRLDQELLRLRLAESINNLTPIPSFNLSLSTVLPQISRYQLESLKERISSIIDKPINLEYDEGKFTIDNEQLGAWIKVIPVESKQLSTLEGFYAFSTQVNADINFDREKIISYLKTLANEINKEPVDAKLTMSDGKVVIFQPNIDGRQLNEEHTLEQIITILENRKLTRASDRNTGLSLDQPLAVQLPIKILKATVTSETIQDLGIKELIGKSSTNFSGSPQNRVHNLTNGTKFLNGLLVKPGEEFSTVESLGRIDDTTGYLPELVIKNNRTIPEFGGGLCQVSTTLFRAVLAAGLKVAARQNHSYRVAYYERGIGPGLDATVYLPKPDFKFLNDTPGWILVQGQVRGNEIIFELYGTSDGRQAKIDGPYTLSTTPAPAPIYEETDELFEGEKKQLEKPHDGAKTVAYYTVTRNGEELFKQTFRSSYKALPARWLVGTKKPESFTEINTSPTNN